MRERERVTETRWAWISFHASITCAANELHDETLAVNGHSFSIINLAFKFSPFLAALAKGFIIGKRSSFAWQTRRRGWTCRFRSCLFSDLWSIAFDWWNGGCCAWQWVGLFGLLLILAVLGLSNSSNDRNGHLRHASARLYVKIVGKEYDKQLKNN